MISPLNVILLLIQVVFSLYVILLMLRILLQWHRVDFYNPVSQFVIKFTDPVVQPIRRILPRFAKVDSASILILIVVETVKLCLLFFIVEHHLPSITPLLQAIFASLLDQLINLFFYAILIGVILSWVATGGRTAISEILNLITEPLLRSIRRSIPSVAGFDLSPLVALIGIKIISLIILQPFLVLT